MAAAGEVPVLHAMSFEVTSVTGLLLNLQKDSVMVSNSSMKDRS